MRRFYARVFFDELGVNSWGLIGLGLGWTFVECLVATVAGAYFYRD